MTIDRDLNVVDAEASSEWVPYPGHCQSAPPAYRALIGLNLFRNFRRNANRLLAGVAGCSHLTELCAVLPTAAIQAFAGDVWNVREEGGEVYLLVGVSVVLLARTGRPAEPFAAPAAFVVPLGFAAVLIAQVALIPLKVPSMNWLAVGYLAAALVAMQAGYALARDGMAETVSRMMAGALLVGGVFAVGTQIVQLFHIEAAVSPFVVVYN
ncbi:DUF2889 domain-containing protein, partial [Burkholderia sola]|uniref:DUF2889 domain-containing protein n=1 Tax=Burkholderia sola TaxID=2843302 RepID=UPI0023DD75C1